MRQHRRSALPQLRRSLVVAWLALAALLIQIAAAADHQAKLTAISVAGDIDVGQLAAQALCHQSDEPIQPSNDNKPPKRTSQACLICHSFQLAELGIAPSQPAHSPSPQSIGLSSTHEIDFETHPRPQLRYGVTRGPPQNLRA
jgi:hypothetical protein